MNNAIAKKEQFGISFDNVTDACFKATTFTVCNNPNQYLFWDGTHPTAQGHELIAEAAFQSTAVPEPLTLLGSGVALGFGAFFRHKSSKVKPKNHDKTQQ